MQKDHRHRTWSRSVRDQLASDGVGSREDLNAVPRHVAALLAREWLLVSRPGQSIHKARKARTFAPEPVGISCLSAAAKKVKVELAIILATFRPDRWRVHVERPVPGIPVIDASAVELGKNVEHGLGRRGRETRKCGKFSMREGSSIPDWARRLNDQVPAVGPVIQDKLWKLEYSAFASDQVHAAAGASTRR